MNRRPRLLVLLAALYALSPFIYPLIVFLFFGVSPREFLDETLETHSKLRIIEIYVLPVVMGVFIFFARRPGYFIVVAGSLYLFVRNFMIYFSARETDPTFTVLMVMNVFFIVVIAYLARRKTRAIYFNSKMRWWETDPRYVVGFPATITRLGKTPVQAILQNIAVGGAAVETAERDFLPHEMVKLQFQSDGTDYELTAGVVWEKPATEGHSLIGVQWVEDKEKLARPKIRKLLKALKDKETPTTHLSPDWQ